MDATDTTASVNQLGDCVAQAAESQRQLFQEMTIFAKGETSRFVHQRLERNGAALEKLQTAQGIAGLIGVQQEWLRDLMQDYLGQQMRLAGAVRGLAQNVAQNVVSEAADAAAGNISRMQQEGREMADQMNQTAQDAAGYVQQEYQH